MASIFPSLAQSSGSSSDVDERGAQLFPSAYVDQPFDVKAFGRNAFEAFAKVYMLRPAEFPMANISTYMQPSTPSFVCSEASAVPSAIDAMGVSLAFSGAMGSGGVTLRLMQKSLCNMLTLLTDLLQQLQDQEAEKEGDGGASPQA